MYKMYKVSLELLVKADSKDTLKEHWVTSKGLQSQQEEAPITRLIVHQNRVYL